MRAYLLILALMFSLPVLSQRKSVETTTKKNSNTSIQTVKSIFSEYIKYPESTDSPETKAKMENALKQLRLTAQASDLHVLIDVWMYYDPTDFPTRELVESILFRRKVESIKAIKYRMQNKKSWENLESAPFNELDYLKKLVEAQK